MLATNSCAMTRNAGSPYDLPRTFVFGQCVIERYFFIHNARFLAASPRRPDVLGKGWISSSMALSRRNLTFVSAHQELGDSRPFASP
jgi:hypothetical protein